MMSLYVGTNSKSFCEYKNFFHIRSIFNSEWYNFVVPKLQSPKDLNINEINKLIEIENSCGKKVSFYINKIFIENYRDFLEKYGYKLCGDEIYLLKDLETEEKISLSDGYKINNKYDLKTVIEVLEKCFPEWPEENKYSEMYEKYKNIGQQNRVFETMVIHLGNEIVGGASVSLDKILNLGYFHNDGISEFHRRKGLHTALIDERCNFCLSNGVDRVVTIVDENAGSYPSFLKNGFEEADKFFVFVKN